MSASTEVVRPMNRTQKIDEFLQGLPELNDNLAGFPKATITQLEEALEERTENRRSETKATYPTQRDRRKSDRRQR